MASLLILSILLFALPSRGDNGEFAPVHDVALHKPITSNTSCAMQICDIISNPSSCNTTLTCNATCPYGNTLPSSTNLIGAGTLSGTGTVNSDMLQLQPLSVYSLAPATTPVINGFALTLIANNSAGCMLSRQASDGTETPWSLCLNETSITLATSTQTVTAELTLPATSLAIVALGGSARLYVNGQRVAQGSLDLSASGSLQLGSASFTGTLQSVRWFTTAIDNIDVCEAVAIPAAACPASSTDPCRCPMDKPVRQIATPNQCSDSFDSSSPTTSRLSPSQYAAAFLNDGNASSMYAVDTIGQEVIITVDLLGLHEFFRMEVEFLSARPHSMVIERSVDNGATFEPYEYISQDCQGVYQLPTRTVQDLISADDVLCRQGDSGPGVVGFALFFSSRGAEVLTRRNGDLNFAFSLATHLRLRLTRPDSTHALGGFYALNNLDVQGRVSCYGHGSTTLSPLDPLAFVASATCHCLHNTTGRNCQQCLPFYRQRPFLRGIRWEAAPCFECECNDRSTTCEHQPLPLSGRCTNCSENTAGDQCEQCQSGFFHVSTASTPFCTACNCSQIGSTSTICDSGLNGNASTAGACLCRPGFVGDQCERCQDGTTLNSINNTCDACQCSATGAVSNVCDPLTGACLCKTGFTGKSCSVCATGHYPVNGICQPCGCSLLGTANASVGCSDQGQCACKALHQGLACDRCTDGAYSINGTCQDCGCSPLGSQSLVCGQDGSCACLPNGAFTGRACDTCKPGTYTLAVEGQVVGCQDCQCDDRGIVANSTCDPSSGQCECKANVLGLNCSQCKDGFVGLEADLEQGCSGVPSGLDAPVLTAANDVEQGPRVNITWTAPRNPNGRLVSYSIIRNGITMATLPVNTTMYLDTAVESAELYSYAVQAQTPAGAVESGLAAVRVPDGRPEGVTSPQASGIGARYVNLTWAVPTKPNGATIQYRILVNGSSAGTTSALALSVTLAPFTWYSITLEACNAQLCSESTPLLVLTLADVPEPFFNFTLDVATATTATFSFEALALNGILDGYELQYRIPNESSIVAFQGMLSSATLSNLSTLTTYEARVGVKNGAFAPQVFGDWLPFVTAHPAPEWSGVTESAVTVQLQASASTLLQNYQLIVNGSISVEQSTAGSIMVPDLAPYTLYELVVRTCFQTLPRCHDSDPSIVRTAESSPLNMSTPTISNVTNRSAIVYWSPPMYPNGVVRNYTVVVNGSMMGVTDGAAGSFALSPLLPFTTYTVEIVATNGAGSVGSLPTPFVTSEALPVDMGDPMVTPLDGFSVAISFEPPTFPNGALRKYSVLVSGFSAVDTMDNNLTVSGLLPVTAYNATVTYFNSIGGVTSRPVPFVTLEAAPSGVPTPIVIPLNATALSVAWTSPSQSNGVLTSFTILVDDQRFGLDASYRSFRLGGFNPNQVYTVALEACTAAGCTLSNTTIATTFAQAPIWKDRPVARALDTTRIELEWLDPSSINQPLVGYAVYRNSSLVTQTNTTTFVDTDLSPNIVYAYFIRAFNDFGSADSAIFSTATLSAAPANLTAPMLVPSRRLINASWTVPTVAPGLSVQNYSLGIISPMFQIVCTTTSTLSCTVSGLQPFTAYSFQLQACTAQACALSPSISVVTLTAAPTDLLPPNVTTTASNISLNWTLPEQPNGLAISYQVWVLGSFLPTVYTDAPRVPASTLFASISTGGSTSLPATTAAPAFEGPRVNLLSPLVSQGAAASADGTVLLNGSNFLTVTQPGPTRGDNFSLYFDLIQNSSTGFLFAQSDAAGVLSLGVFSVAPASTLFIIYSGNGFNESQIAFTGVNLNDGSRHWLLLSFTDSDVTLRLDERAPQTKTLQGAVVDCWGNSSNCISHVGQRASAVGSNSRLTGTLFAALWFPQAGLTRYPSLDDSSTIGTTSIPSAGSTAQPPANFPLPLNFNGQAVLTVSTAELSAVVSGLRPYSNFAVLLQANNSAGTADADIVQGTTDAALPSVSQLPIVQQRSATSVTIGYTFPDGINGVLVGYQAQATDVATNTTFSAVLSISLPQTIDGLSPFTQYDVRILVVNEVGQGFSPSVGTTTFEAEPANLLEPTVSAMARAAIVTWHAPLQLNGILLAYSLRLDGAIVYTDRNTSTTLAPLLPATSYALELEACNIAGCTSVNSTFMTLEDAPEGVSALQPLNVSARSVLLAWSVPERANGNVTYSIVRQTSSVDQTIIANSTALQYMDLEVLPASQYNYTLVASTAGGSTPSITLAIVTLEAAPMGMSAPKVLSVEARSINASIPLPSVPNGQIVSTTLRAVGPNRVVVNTTGVVTTVVEGLIPASPYQLVAEACTSAGCTISESTEALTKEALPVGLAAPVIQLATSDAIRVSWSTPNHTNGVLLQYSVTVLAAQFSVTRTFNVSTLSAQFTNLSPATTYLVLVEACNAIGCVDTSTTVTTANAAPEGIKAPVLKAAPPNSVEVAVLEPERPNGDILEIEVLVKLIEDRLRKRRETFNIINGSTFQQELAVSPSFGPDVLSSITSAYSDALDELSSITVTLDQASSAIVVTAQLVDESDSDAVLQKADAFITTGTLLANLQRDSTANRDTIVQLVSRAVLLGVEPTNSPTVTTSLPNTVEPNGVLRAVSFGTNRSGTVSDLKFATGYEFQLRMHTSGGVATGNTSQVTTLEGAPAGLPSPFVEALSSTSLRASFREPSLANGVLISYQLEIDGVLTELSAVASPITFDDLPIYSVHQIRSRLCTKVGCTFSPVAQARTMEDVPSGLSTPVITPFGATRFEVQATPPDTPNGVISLYKFWERELVVCPLDEFRQQQGHIFVSSTPTTVPAPIIISNASAEQSCVYISCQLDENICGRGCYGLDEVCCGDKAFQRQQGFECCGNNYLAKNEATDVCCGSTFEPRNTSRVCCGSEYAPISSGSICCEGTVGVGDGCCGNIPFLSNASRVCCGGRLLDAVAGSTCCGDSLVSNDQVCCSTPQRSAGHTFQAGNMCCGSEYINASVSICCQAENGATAQYTFPTPLSKLNSNSKCCASSLIDAGLGCCNGLAYNVTTSTCSDSSSANAKHCGSGRVCPLESNASAVCDTCSFDTTTKVCGAAQGQFVPLCHMNSTLSTFGPTRKQVLSGLKPATPYEVQVEAVNGAGFVRSEWVKQQTRAAIVSPPSAEAWGISTIALSWDTSDDVLLYQLVRDGLVVHNTTQTQYLDQNLIADTTYVYSLRAVTSSGTIHSVDTSVTTSAMHLQLVATPACQALTSTAILVNWSQTINISEYRLSTNGRPSTSAGLGVSSVFPELQPFTLYNVTLLSCTAIAGCTASNQTCNVRTLPATPVGLAAPELESVNASVIRVSWREPALPNGILTAFTVLATPEVVDGEVVTAPTTSIIDVGLRLTTTFFVESSAQYRVQIRANNSVGSITSSSAFWPPVLATVLPPSIDGEIFADMVTLAWSASESALSYMLIVSSDGQQEQRVSAGRNTTATVRALAANTSFSVVLVVTNLAGNTTSEPLLFTTAPLPRLPEGVAIPSAVALSPTAILVTWEPPLQPNGEIVSFDLFRLEPAVGNSTLVRVYSGLNRAKVDDTVVPATTYSYYLEVSNSAGSTLAAANGTTRVSVSTPASLPAGQAEPVLSALSNLSLAASWAPPSNANGVIRNYSLEYREVGVSSISSIFAGLSLSAITPVLLPFTSYEIRTLVTNEVGSARSTWARATTCGAKPEPPVIESTEAASATAVSLRWRLPSSLPGTFPTTRIIIDNTSSVNTTGRLDATVDGLEVFTVVQLVLELCVTEPCGEALVCSLSDVVLARSGEAPPVGLAAPSLNVTGVSSIAVSWEPPTAPNGIILRYQAMRAIATNVLTFVPVYDGLLTSFEDANLEPDTEYLYRVRAQNSAGDVVSASAAARTADGSPLNISQPVATSQLDLSTTVCWQLPGNPKGVIVSYTLLVDNRVAYSGLALCASLGVLQPDTGYRLTVEVCNSLGCSRSTVVEYTTPCAPPQSREPVSITPSQRSIAIEWREPTQLNCINTSFQLLVFASEVTTAFPLQSINLSQSDIFVVENLDPNTRYVLRVESTNQVATTAGALVATRTLEGTPSGIFAPTLLALSSTSVQMDWKTPASPGGAITRYDILQNGRFVGTTTTRLFLAGGLEPFTNYTFIVVACTRVGCEVGPPSSIATPEAPPRGFDSLSVVGVTADSLNVSWQLPSNPNGQISSYMVELQACSEDHDSKSCVPQTTPLTLNANVTSLSLGNLSPATAYRVRATAINSAGSTRSSWINDFEGEPLFTLAGLADVVNALQCEVLGSSTVFCDWSSVFRSNGQPSMYRIVVASDDLADEREINVAPPEASVVISSLAADTSYSIVVAHINEAGDAYANTSVRTDLAPAQASPPPEPDVQQSRSSTSSGELAGLAIGGTLLLLILLVIFWALRHRYTDTHDLKTAPAIPSETAKDARPFWQQESDQIELRPAATIAPTTNPGRLFAMSNPMLRDDISHKSFDLLNPAFLLESAPEPQPHLAYNSWNEDPAMALTTLLSSQTQALHPAKDPETAEFAYYNLLQASDTDGPLPETRFASTVPNTSRSAIFAPVDPRMLANYAAFEEDTSL
eukprot:m.279018 g.279018  ORF g.279018 m.279018 type:complete len:4572 (-) comp17723_c0_seq1:48-13763(-)